MDDDFINPPDNIIANESNETTPDKSKTNSPGLFSNAQIGFRDILRILENPELKNVLTAPVNMVKPFSQAGEVIFHFSIFHKSHEALK